MLCRILGPVEVWADGQWTSVGAPKWRAMLAGLLVEPGTVVSTEQLIDELWGDDPPAAARKLVSGYVMRLRRLIGDAQARVLVTQPPGYKLVLARGDLDMWRFQDSLAAGRAALAAGDARHGADLLASGLALWRGRALADVPPGPLATAARARLEELRLAAVELSIEASIGCGHGAELVPELRALTSEYPLRERFWFQLMSVLDGCGRSAEALSAYVKAREVIAGDLGVDPGQELRQLHERILGAKTSARRRPGGGEPRGVTATGTGPQPVAGPRSAVVPRQLPAGVRHFVGRRAELQMLDSLLAETADTGGTVAITVISGTAGVGKTALALHWAHRVSSRFPDGQLYVNLRGFGPSGTPVNPGEALLGFLDALGVASGAVPAGPDAQAAMYRSLLAGKKMLVLLDNARSVSQVRPLLPGCSGCLVVITSRNPLSALAVNEAALSLELELLTNSEARELLARRLGPARVASEEQAATELIGMCSRLPLALAIAAARAAARSSLTLATLNAELREARQLDALETGDAGDAENAAISIRAVFSWSYRTQGQPAARMFRLLGVHPGPDITVAAAASLVGVPARQARESIAELITAHLLTEITPGRFAFHDLLRSYAAELAQDLDENASRQAAAGRVLDHYLHSAYAADRQLSPQRETINLDPVQPGTLPEHMSGYQGAWEWFEAEHLVLAQAVRLAADRGFGRHAWRIPWALETFYYRRGHWRELADSQRIALGAARQPGDLSGQAHARRILGRACALLGSYDEAHAHLSLAASLFQTLGDRAGQARTSVDIALAFARQGHFRKALDHSEQARRLYLVSGHEVGHAGALNNVGWYHVKLGNYANGRTWSQLALNAAREAGDVYCEAVALDSLGWAYHHLGRHAESIAHCQQSLSGFRKLGARHPQAVSLAHLGEAHRALGDFSTAHRCWQEALPILDDLNHPDAVEVRRKLQAIPDAIRNAAR